MTVRRGIGAQGLTICNWITVWWSVWNWNRTGWSVWNWNWTRWPVCDWNWTWWPVCHWVWAVWWPVGDWIGGDGITGGHVTVGRGDWMAESISAGCRWDERGERRRLGWAEVMLVVLKGTVTIWNVRYQDFIGVVGIAGWLETGKRWKDSGWGCRLSSWSLERGLW